MGKITAKSFYENLVPYLGEKAALFIDNQTKDLKFHLKITKPRDTKFGDYLPEVNNNRQRITINGNLDKYSFLITLLHELAHLYVQENVKVHHKPHGEEWKTTFAQLLTLAVKNELFPLTVTNLISKLYIRDHKFTHTSRVKILNAIYKELNLEIPIRLENLPVNAVALLPNGMKVVKLNQQRTRCLCRDMNDNKLYYVNKHIEVTTQN
jgi:hypothetical protein